MIECIISYFLSIVSYFFYLIQDNNSKLSSRPKTWKKKSFFSVISKIFNLVLSTNVFTVSDRAHLVNQSDICPSVQSAKTFE